MFKLVQVFLCVHFCALLAYSYNMPDDYEDDFYFDIEGYGAYLNERNANRLTEGRRPRICGDLICTEIVKGLSSGNRDPTHVYNVECEICYNKTENDYVHVGTDRKDMIVFQKKNKGCFQPTTIKIKTGCHCSD